MKTIWYYDKGEAIADCNAERLAREFLLDPGQGSISVSTENFITAIRVLVYKDVYPHDQVIFCFEDARIPVDKNGRLPYWPKGFCDYNDHWLDQLLVPK